MLDFHLAGLYDDATKALNQAVRRNIERFPTDFMFQLTSEESAAILRSQIVTSNDKDQHNQLTHNKSLRSQLATSKGATALGGRRYHLLAFTEQGVAMLSSVLRSGRAVQVNIAIMRAFVKLRQLLATHADLAHKLAALEKKYDAQFKVVFDAIRALMEKPSPAPVPSGEIGFHTLMPAQAPAPRRPGHGRKRSS